MSVLQVLVNIVQQEPAVSQQSVKTSHCPCLVWRWEE